MVKHNRGRHRWGRRVVSLVSAAALVVALAACSPGKASTESTVNLGLVGSVNDEVYPYGSQFTGAEAAIYQNIYDTLTVQDNEGKLGMGLAESFTPNADNTVWTVNLRPGVKLHKGGTFGADDVVYSIKEMFDHAETFGGVNQISSFVDPNEVKKINDLTVQFTLKEPFGVFPNVWSNRDLPMIGHNSTVKDPDGTGPFTVKSFAPNRQATLQKFDGYWGQKPGFKTLNIYFFQDQQAIVHALQGGQIDLSVTIPLADVSTLKSAGIQFVTSKSAMYVTMDMRTDIPPFDNPLVREALALAIDREQIVKTAYNGFATVGNDYNEDAQCPAPDVPQREQDLAKAKQLLAQAGNPKVTVDLVDAGVQSGSLETTQLIEQDAAKIGMTVTARKLDAGSLLEKWLEWPFVVNIVISDYLSAVPVSSLPGGPGNASHFNDPQFNALAEQLFNTPDPDAQCPIIQKMQTIQYQQVPSLILAYPDTLTPYASRIHGLHTDLFGRTAYTFGGVTVD